MSNALFHNKWHGFNHFTVSLEGYPDSGTDPIASLEQPFRGTFYNVISGIYGKTISEITITDPGSGYTVSPIVTLVPNIPKGGIVQLQPAFIIGVNVQTKQISSIRMVESGRYLLPVNLSVAPASADVGNIKTTAYFTLCSKDYTRDSNSDVWQFYTSLTVANSSDWQLYPSVRATTIANSANWNLGYSGYVTQKELSGLWSSVYTQASSLSSEVKYDFKGGTGWHIALSSITHRLNVSDQANIAQKVAVPVKLYEHADKTVYWETSAQTAYFNLTGNYSLTATNAIDARKGGKYTMWLYVDSCPEIDMNFTFYPSAFNISVKGWDDVNKKETWTESTNNVLLLEADSITRIDFVFDGERMLGRCTHYKVFLDQTDDMYFQGTAIKFKDTTRPTIIRNPVFINAIYPYSGKSFSLTGPNDSDKTGIIIVPEYVNYPDRITNRSDFDSNSSLYIAGSGIYMRYLNANMNYFSFNLYGAVFPSQLMLTKFKNLTSSFDRVTFTLSGGDWTDPLYADNLVATPDASLLTSAVSAAFPQPPYVFTSSNIKAVTKCLSSLTVKINSGINRDISNLYVNGIAATIVPSVCSGMTQPFNFINERSCELTFTRIQSDHVIEVYYSKQVPFNISQNLLTFMSMNEYGLHSTNNLRLTGWDNSVTNNYKLESTALQGPALNTEAALRVVQLSNGKSMTLNTGLSVLSSNKLNFFKDFSTFTVFKTSTFPVSSVIWWIGDFTGTTEQKGYGLYLSAGSNNSLTARLFTVSNFRSMDRAIGSKRDITTIYANQTYVVCTNYDPVRNSGRDYRRQEIYINNKPSVYQRSLTDASFNLPLTSTNLIFNKHPNEDTCYSNVKLYDFYLYNKGLSRSEILKMNKFLMEKINGYNYV